MKIIGHNDNIALDTSLRIGEHQMATLNASFVAKSFIEAANMVGFGNMETLGLRETDPQKAKLTIENATYAYIEIKGFEITINMIYGERITTEVMLKIIEIVERKLGISYRIKLI